GRNQEGWPVDAMEANDFLANHVQVGGPKLVIKSCIRRTKTQRGNVIRECVEPHVNHVLGIVRHWDTPGERAAADGEIPQTGADERHDFVAPRLWPDEVGLLGVQLY